MDVSVSEDAAESLVLSPYTREQLDRFLESVTAFDRLNALGLGAPNRLLLQGPPGTGKTSIARSVASRLGLPLVTTRSDALVSSLLGQTSRNIREVFDFASRLPCVLLLDEFDALAKNRADAHEIGELQRVVIALLENLDALGDAPVVIAATNHPHLLDPAIWRRFPYKIQTELPGHQDRKVLWRQYLGQIEATVKDVDRLAGASGGMSAAAIETAALDVARDLVLAGSDTLDLPRALRRLARFLRYEDFELFNDEVNEIRFLRSWAPDVFTIRVLTSTFRTSARRVGAILGGGQNARSESDPVTSLRTEGAN